MYLSFFYFALFLFWAIVALFMFIVLPYFAPEMMPKWVKEYPLLRYGIILFAVYNLVRWMGVRQTQKRQQDRDMMEESYRVKTNPLRSPRNEEEKPVIFPEFKFDDEDPSKPPPPNGTSH